MMKRASANFHQSHALDEEARARIKHKTLLKEHLELQKEFVSKKRKLRTTQQKRDTLLAEVRFLRQRRKYLLKIQSQKLEPENYLVQSQNADIERKTLEREGDYSVYEAALGNPCPVLMISSPNSRDEEKGREEKEVVREPLRVGKKRKSYLIDDKKVGKKKILWRDQVTLKV